MNFFLRNAWIIAILPLIVFLTILLGRNLINYKCKKISSYLTIGATFLGLIFSTFILLWTLKTPDALFQYNFTWLQAGNIKLSFGWMIDNLSAMMLMIVTSVSLLIQIYSQEYMEEDSGYHRFFAFLALFNFSMLGLVMSTNLFQIYIFWELVGLSSYLLIGFWFKRPSAANAAMKAFIMNRIGDFALLIGIIAFFYYSVSWWPNHPNVFLGFTSLSAVAPYVLKSAGPLIYTLIALGLLTGSIAKSAQIPLHTWLPDAMEGPTTISALIHAATMVAAGVYLIARVYPIFKLSPIILIVLAGIGLVTAFGAALKAMTQVDIKRILAYSTCSQLGFMFLGMGVGAYSGSLFHLMTHAYFKAMLFLCAGAVIHGLSDQQDLRYMGGLRKQMPIVAFTYLIGTMAISGMLFSGFWSKDEILASIISHSYTKMFTVAIITSAMTSFYMFRSYFLIFEGEYKGAAHPHNPSITMTIPLLLLAVPSILLGFLFSGHLSKFGIHSFVKFIHFGTKIENLQGLFVSEISLIAAFTGFIIAAALYWDKFFIKINPDKIKSSFGLIYEISYGKSFFDKFYNFLIHKLFLPLANLLNLIDKYIIDGLVNLTAYKVKIWGKILSLFQNGNLQTYATILFGGLLAITLATIFIYLN